MTGIEGFRKPRIVGYARVSTASQDHARQVELLQDAGASVIYAEKVSGARADRPKLAKLMRELRSGDTVMVAKIDRLGRSTRELLNLIEEIPRSARASCRWAIRYGTLPRHRGSCCERCSLPLRTSSAT
jgi:predicted site-specific integrase-resolvase